MSLCNYTAFDRIIYLTKPLLKNKLKEGANLLQDNSLCDLLDFCTENGCFSKEQAAIVEAFIMVFEDLDGTYWENHPENYTRLLDEIGLTRDIVYLCTAYDDAVQEAKRLPDDKLEEGRELLESGLDRMEGLNYLLTFCGENGCIDESHEYNVYSLADEFEGIDHSCKDMRELSYAGFLEAVGIIDANNVHDGEGS